MAMNDVTARLRELRKRAGMSMAQLAKALGYSHSSGYQRYEDASLTKRLRYEFVVKLAEVLVGKGDPPIEQHEVMALAERGAHRPKNDLIFPRKNVVDIEDLSRSHGIPVEAIPAKVATFLPNADFIPLLGARAGQDAEVFLMKDGPIGHAERPPILKNVRDAYAMHCLGDSMRPMYRQGQTLFVHPYLPPRREDGVIIRLENDAVLVKEFVRQTETDLVVKEYQPVEREFTIPLSRVVTIHTVVSVQG